MFTINLKRSVGALAVAAGLLAVAAPAGAQAGPATIGGTTPAVTVLDQDLNSVRAAGTLATPAVPGVTPQGFIMKDGSICDPIRHMGC